MVKKINTVRSYYSPGIRVAFVDVLTVAVIAILAFLQIGGIRSVPFHPDESTYLFMSADLETYLRDPSALAFDQSADISPRMKYRLIDAPMTRYLAGAALYITGQKPLTTDWDWGLSVADNASAGAFPSSAALNAGRLAVSALLPLTLLLYFLTARNLAGSWAGLLAVVLLGLNGLTSLHARRVMTEGPLLFGSVLFLWALTMPRIRPALLALGLAVAVNSKHTALVLAPVAVLGIVLSSRKGRTAKTGARSWRSLFLKGTATLTLVFIGITFILNPVAWRNPLAALQTSIQLRADLVERQTEGTELLAPDSVLRTPADRVVALLANTYLLKPSFAEVGNYSEWSARAVANYMTRAESNLFRGPVFGVVLAVLSVFGMVVGLLTARREASPLKEQYALLLVTTILEIVAVLAAIPLPWQRFVLPLLPFTNLWIAIGVTAIGRSFRIPEIERRKAPQEMQSR